MAKQKQKTKQKRKQKQKQKPQTWEGKSVFNWKLKIDYEETECGMRQIMCKKCKKSEILDNILGQRSGTF